MSDLAPLLQRFFTDKLDQHMNASVHTKAAYADTFRLLLLYAQQAAGTAPSALRLADLDADLIGGFLQHLETVRGNSAATRNARRAALRSFFTLSARRLIISLTRSPVWMPKCSRRRSWSESSRTPDASTSRPATPSGSVSTTSPTRTWARRS